MRSSPFPFAITKSLITIGRSALSDVCLADLVPEASNFVSREHCQISCVSVKDGETTSWQFFLKNLGKNGTRVNQQQVVTSPPPHPDLHSNIPFQHMYEAAAIPDGCVVSVGRVEMRLQVVPPSNSAEVSHEK